MAPDLSLPLAGIRVLDFSNLLPGPLASLLLAEAGAEVVKVERPGSGDEMRGYEPAFGDSSGNFALLNRGKTSLCADLKDEADQKHILDLARSADVLIEQFIVGDEFTVSIVDRQVLPSIRIVPAKGFYDYAAKYVTGDTQYLCPGADGESEAEMQRLALIAFDAIGCSGWGRIDFMRDRDGRLFLLEVNTAPGMTERSLVPKAAAQVGIDYPALCWRILESSFAEGSA